MNQHAYSRPASEMLPRYRTTLAGDAAHVRAAQLLRYQVFNLELGEGLQRSHLDGADVDEFDAQCDHLLLEDTESGELVGTYRMQSGERAAQGRGYYCAQEFDLRALDPLRGQVLELGRACLASEHRNYAALSALWRGIADYAQSRRLRYLIGCSSLTSQDPAEGCSAWWQLSRHLIEPTLRMPPQPSMACSLARSTPSPVKIPKLLSAYIGLGAKVCGPPALDPDFRTIDFLTLLDLRPESVWSRHRLARFGVSLPSRRAG